MTRKIQTDSDDYAKELSVIALSGLLVFIFFSIIVIGYIALHIY